MPIPFALGEAADLTDVAIQRIWIKSADDANVVPTYFDKYFNVETGVTDRLLRDSSITGSGEATRITENAIITGEAPVQGYDQTYTQIEYGKLLAGFHNRTHYRRTVLFCGSGRTFDFRFSFRRRRRQKVCQGKKYFDVSIG